MRDLRALASLNHPNIVHLYGCGAYQANLFLGYFYNFNFLVKKKIKKLII